ncbi:MAG TPA: hypothetical protein VD886_13235, partial [Herpetosiphonaceae bacterium]|nr:hypothetical protein [Herpetosiphonaceae bacterium]
MPTNFDLEALGLTRDLYARMQSVSNFRRCEIWIRATNPGVIEGFSMGKNVTGKTLFTKVKSSNYPPIKANLAFFAPLSKPKDTPPPPASNEGKDFWESQIKDQKALLEVVLGETPKPYANQAYPSQVFIPKVLPAQLLIGRLRLQELGGLAAGGAPPAWIRIVSGYGTSG